MKLILSSYFTICYFLIFACSVNAGEIHVAAAASLTHVLEELSVEFSKESNHSLKISYASSGTLTHQIMQGAPFDLFLSANKGYVDLLAAKGFTRDEGKIYGYGYLVLFVPDSSNLVKRADFEDQDQILKSDSLQKLVMANPQHAPYGYIAKQYLQSIGIWEEIYHKIVFANSASQATQFGLSGVADAAFIPLSQIKIMDTGHSGKFVLIDKNSYEPLQHVVVLMKNAGRASEEFQEFILGGKGQEILSGYGFGYNDF